MTSAVFTFIVVYVNRKKRWRGTLKNPNCSTAISIEYVGKTLKAFTSLDMSEKFSSRMENPKYSNNHIVNIDRVKS